MAPTLEDPVLGAAALKRLVGLTYRQLNEWDQRQSLPHQRETSGGWRRVNAWQAMALAVVAELHQSFGVSLVRQQWVLSWLLGGTHTERQKTRLLAAEDRLADFTVEEKQRQQEWLDRALKNGRDIGSGVTLIRRDGGPVGANAEVAGSGSRDLVDAQIASTSARLQNRGWPQEEATTFASAFFKLSTLRETGITAITTAHKLARIAETRSDSAAARATGLLACAIMPMFEACTLMNGGYPVLLATNLREAVVLDEPAYIEWMPLDLIPQPGLLVRIDDKVNSVLAEINQPTVPIHSRAQEPFDLDEREIIDIVKRKNFTSLRIAPKAGGYHVVVEKNVSNPGKHSVLDSLRDADYQTLTLTRHKGQVVRLTQEKSLLTRSAHDGKTPNADRKATRTHPR